MKKLFLIFLLCAFSFSVFCEEAQESNSGLNADNKENPSPLVTGDIFIDAAPGLVLGVFSIGSMILYHAEHHIINPLNDGHDGETLAWDIGMILGSAAGAFFPFEPVYYRLKNEDGSYNSYFGNSYPLNITGALYFGEKFYTALKLGGTFDLCIRNYSFKPGVSAEGSVVFAYEPISFIAGLRAGFFEGQSYLAPSVGLEYMLCRDGLFSFTASYSDARIFGKDLIRISTGMRCTLFNHKQSEVGLY